MPHGLSILVVDDSEHSRALAKAMLPEDCTVDEAVNGMEAVRKYAVGKYDVVLMDVLMPVMDGAEATETIRALESVRASKAGIDLRPVPILMFSADDHEEPVMRCARSGCTAFIPKPFARHDLLECIRTHTQPFPV